MEILPYEMTAWQLNQTYEKIINCKVVPPPYDIDGFYSGEFYLDKRDWLVEKYLDEYKCFLDSKEIGGIVYYYYYTETSWDPAVTKWYIGTYENNSWECITPYWFILSANSPKRIVYWRWPNWPTWWTITITESTSLNWDITFKYTWTSLAVWDYIMFTTWDLSWFTTKIDIIDPLWYVHIVTNDLATFPVVWVTATIYPAATTSIWYTLCIWHTNSSWHWVISEVMVDWINEWEVHIIKTDTEHEIIDIVNYDTNIFAITKYFTYFTKAYAYTNSNFYKNNFFKIDNWTQLFAIWDSLLVFANQNKIYAAVPDTDKTYNTYIQYNLNYNWDTLSKYSTIFSDQTIYILQKDKQLMQVDVKKVNLTTYELNVKNALLNTRWIFDALSWWEFYLTASQNYLNFLYQKDWSTTNYQFNKQYQHWIINEYPNQLIYKIEDWWDVLTDWWILKETNTAYTDLDVPYKQEVNFYIIWGQKMYMPIAMRTMFWIKQFEEPMPEIDVNLSIDFDMWWKRTVMQRRLNNYNFDLRLNESITWDELIWYDTWVYEVSEYDWNVVSLQTTILKTWRFIRFKYNSFNRFCIWPSYVFTDFTKPFINEINCNN